jgi:hypothetical protein
VRRRLVLPGIHVMNDYHSHYESPQKTRRSRLAVEGDQQGVGAGEVSFAKTSISSYNGNMLLY